MRPSDRRTDDRRRDGAALRDEALCFSRYLLDQVPEPEMVERYVSASHALFGAGVSRSDQVLIDFCRRHPRYVGVLDSAAGVLRPTSVLRKKILVMAAILEAAPRFAPEFIRARTSVPGLVFGVVWLATIAACKFLIGAVLLVVLREPRS